MRGTRLLPMSRIGSPGSVPSCTPSTPWSRRTRCPTASTSSNAPRMWSRRPMSPSSSPTTTRSPGNCSSATPERSSTPATGSRHRASTASDRDEAAVGDAEQEAPLPLELTRHTLCRIALAHAGPPGIGELRDQGGLPEEAVQPLCEGAGVVRGHEDPTALDQLEDLADGGGDHSAAMRHRLEQEHGQRLLPRGQCGDRRARLPAEHFIMRDRPQQHDRATVGDRWGLPVPRRTGDDQPPARVLRAYRAPRVEEDVDALARADLPREED